MLKASRWKQVSDRSMEVKLFALLGNYNRQGQREVFVPIGTTTSTLRSDGPIDA